MFLNKLIKRSFLSLTGTIVIFAGWEFNSHAWASIVRLGESNFRSASDRISFNEFPIGTTNPTYSPADYDGDSQNAPTVSFGGFFSGQSLGNEKNCPPGANLNGCVVGNPSNSLSLAPDSPETFIAQQGNTPNSPILSGTPKFEGPVSVLFDSNLAGVGLDSGFFEVVGGAAIKAFSRDGSLLGSVSNQQKPVEFLGLATEDGSEQIAGLQFSLVGAEPDTYAIDNLTFARAGQLNLPGKSVPEPASAMGAGLAFGLAALLRKWSNGLSV